MKFQKWIQEHRNHITALSAVLIIFGLSENLLDLSCSITLL